MVVKNNPDSNCSTVILVMWKIYMLRKRLEGYPKMLAMLPFTGGITDLDYLPSVYPVIFYYGKQNSQMACDSSPYSHTFGWVEPVRQQVLLTHTQQQRWRDVTPCVTLCAKMKEFFRCRVGQSVGSKLIRTEVHPGGPGVIRKPVKRGSEVSPSPAGLEEAVMFEVPLEMGSL